MKPLQDLQNQILSLPVQHRQYLLSAFNRVQEADNRRKRILDIVQETLAQVRLDMKYLVFDLECTRRERDEALN